MLLGQNYGKNRGESQLSPIFSLKVGESWDFPQVPPPFTDGRDDLGITINLAHTWSHLAQ